MECASESVSLKSRSHGWWTCYVPLLNSLAKPDSDVLDLGCGWRHESHCAGLKQTRTCIGTDVDPMITRQVLRTKVRADAHNVAVR